MVTGSYLGLPLSTTHCIVGATTAVGLLEGGKGVSWRVIGKSVLGWIFTLIVAGLTSALIMALGIFTPNLRSVQARCCSYSTRAPAAFRESGCNGTCTMLRSSVVRRLQSSVQRCVAPWWRTIFVEFFGTAASRASQVVQVGQLHNMHVPSRSHRPG